MNTKLLKLVTVFALTFVLVSTVAMAAPSISGKPVQTSPGVYSTTVNVAGVGSSDTVSLLVVEPGTDLTDFTSEDILFVAQKKATTGSASFEFVTTTKAFDVYAGYTTKSREELPLDVTYVSGPQMDTAKSQLATGTSPFSKSGFRRIFIKLTNDENGNWVPVHSGEGSEIYYSTELQGYDGLVKTSATELGAIFEEITWTEGTPSADQTIAKYGDMDGNGRFTTNDYNYIKKIALKRITFTVKQLLTADTDDSSRITTGDYNEIKKVALRRKDEFTNITNKK